MHCAVCGVRVSARLAQVDFKARELLCSAHYEARQLQRKLQRQQRVRQQRARAPAEDAAPALARPPPPPSTDAPTSAGAGEAAARAASEEEEAASAEMEAPGPTVEGGGRTPQEAAARSTRGAASLTEEDFSSRTSDSSAASEAAGEPTDDTPDWLVQAEVELQASTGSAEETLDDWAAADLGPAVESWAATSFGEIAALHQLTMRALSAEAALTERAVAARATAQLADAERAAAERVSLAEREAAAGRAAAARESCAKGRAEARAAEALAAAEESAQAAAAERALAQQASSRLAAAEAAMAALAPGHGEWRAVKGEAPRAGRGVGARRDAGMTAREIEVKEEAAVKITAIERAAAEREAAAHWVVEETKRQISHREQWMAHEKKEAAIRAEERIAAAQRKASEWALVEVERAAAAASERIAAEKAAAEKARVEQVKAQVAAVERAAAAMVAEREAAALRRASAAEAAAGVARRETEDAQRLAAAQMKALKAEAAGQLELRIAEVQRLALERVAAVEKAALSRAAAMERMEGELAAARAAAAVAAAAERDAREYSRRVASRAGAAEVPLIENVEGDPSAVSSETRMAASDAQAAGRRLTADEQQALAAEAAAALFAEHEAAAWATAAAVACIEAQGGLEVAERSKQQAPGSPEVGAGVNGKTAMALSANAATLLIAEQETERRVGEDSTVDVANALSPVVQILDKLAALLATANADKGAEEYAAWRDLTIVQDAERQLPRDYPDSMLALRAPADAEDRAAARGETSAGPAAELPLLEYEEDAPSAWGIDERMTSTDEQHELAAEAAAELFADGESPAWATAAAALIEAQEGLEAAEGAKQHAPGRMEMGAVGDEAAASLDAASAGVDEETAMALSAGVAALLMAEEDGEAKVGERDALDVAAALTLAVPPGEVSAEGAEVASLRDAQAQILDAVTVEQHTLAAEAAAALFAEHEALAWAAAAAALIEAQEGLEVPGGAKQQPPGRVEVGAVSAPAEGSDAVGTGVDETASMALAAGVAALLMAEEDAGSWAREGDALDEAEALPAAAVVEMAKTARQLDEVRTSSRAEEYAAWRDLTIVEVAERQLPRDYPDSMLALRAPADAEDRAAAGGETSAGPAAELPLLEYEEDAPSAWGIDERMTSTDEQHELAAEAAAELFADGESTAWATAAAALIEAQEGLEAAEGAKQHAPGRMEMGAVGDEAAASLDAASAGVDEETAMALSASVAALLMAEEDGEAKVGERDALDVAAALTLAVPPGEVSAEGAEVASLRDAQAQILDAVTVEQHTLAAEAAAALFAEHEALAWAAAAAALIEAQEGLEVPGGAKQQPPGRVEVGAVSAPAEGSDAVGAGVDETASMALAAGVSALLMAEEDAGSWAREGDALDEAEALPAAAVVELSAEGEEVAPPQDEATSPSTESGTQDFSVQRGMVVGRQVTERDGPDSVEPLMLHSKGAAGEHFGMMRRLTRSTDATQAVSDHAAVASQGHPALEQSLDSSGLALMPHPSSTAGPTSNVDVDLAMGMGQSKIAGTRTVSSTEGINPKNTARDSEGQSVRARKPMTLAVMEMAAKLQAAAEAASAIVAATGNAGDDHNAIHLSAESFPYEVSSFPEGSSEMERMMDDRAAHRTNVKALEFHEKGPDDISTFGSTWLRQLKHSTIVRWQKSLENKSRAKNGITSSTQLYLTRRHGRHLTSALANLARHASCIRSLHFFETQAETHRGRKLLGAALSTWQLYAAHAQAQVSIKGAPIFRQRVAAAFELLQRHALVVSDLRTACIRVKVSRESLSCRRTLNCWLSLVRITNAQRAASASGLLLRQTRRVSDSFECLKRGHFARTHILKQSTALQLCLLRKAWAHSFFIWRSFVNRQHILAPQAETLMSTATSMFPCFALRRAVVGAKLRGALSYKRQLQAQACCQRRTMRRGFCAFSRAARRFNCYHPTVLRSLQHFARSRAVRKWVWYWQQGRRLLVRSDAVAKAKAFASWRANILEKLAHDQATSLHIFRDFPEPQELHDSELQQQSKHATMLQSHTLSSNESRADAVSPAHFEFGSINAEERVPGEHTLSTRSSTTLQTRDASQPNALPNPQPRSPPPRRQFRAHVEDAPQPLTLETHAGAASLLDEGAGEGKSMTMAASSISMTPKAQGVGDSGVEAGPARDTSNMVSTPPTGKRGARRGELTVVDSENSLRDCSCCGSTTSTITGRRGTPNVAGFGKSPSDCRSFGRSTSVSAEMQEAPSLLGCGNSNRDCSSCGTRSSMSTERRGAPTMVGLDITHRDCSNCGATTSLINGRGGAPNCGMSHRDCSSCGATPSTSMKVQGTPKMMGGTSARSSREVDLERELAGAQLLLRRFTDVKSALSVELASQLSAARSELQSGRALPSNDLIPDAALNGHVAAPRSSAFRGHASLEDRSKAWRSFNSNASAANVAWHWDRNRGLM